MITDQQLVKAKSIIQTMNSPFIVKQLLTDFISKEEDRRMKKSIKKHLIFNLFFRS